MDEVDTRHLDLHPDPPPFFPQDTLMSLTDPCTGLPATIQLDPGGVGPLIDYSMYPKVCFAFAAPVAIPVDKGCFQKELQQAPANHFWAVMPKKPVAELRDYVRRHFAAAVIEAAT